MVGGMWHVAFHLFRFFCVVLHSTFHSRPVVQSTVQCSVVGLSLATCFLSLGGQVT